MDKRTIQFILITVIIWSAFVLARLTFFEAPQPQKVVDKAGQVNDGAGKEEPGNEDKTENPVEPIPPDEPAPGEKTEDEETTKSPERKLITLGSLDPSSPYRLLVTLDSRGAALQRVELARFFDIEDRSGYLGIQDLEPTQGGCRIDVIGAGTPAALASAVGQEGGIRVDDILTQIGDQPVKLPIDVTNFLSKTRPGQQVEVTVTRPVNGAATKLVFTTALTRRPLAIVNPETHIEEIKDGKTISTDPFSLLMTIDTIGKKSLAGDEEDLPGILSPRVNNWEISNQGADFVEYKFPISARSAKALGATGKLELVKRYELKPLANAQPKDRAEQAPAYHLTLTIGIRNLGTEPVALAYKLDGLNGLPLEGWWYSVKMHPEMFAAAGARDVVYRFTGLAKQMMGAPRIVSEGRKLLDAGSPLELSLLPSSGAEPLDYIAVDTQFFVAAVLPVVEKDAKPPLFRKVYATAEHDVRKIARKRERTANTSFSLTSDIATVEPSGELKQSFTVFLGPKDPPILAPYNGLGALVEYGWQYAALPALLLRAVLDFLHSICRNYFLAIVLLTIVVRCCMLPFSLRQAKSAAKMQELAPEMAKVREKYKDDMEGQGKAMQELYKKHNFNPFGGCLLMFFQLPIFVGLYRCLAVDIDLRDAPMIPGIQWASNLAGPDRLFDWKEMTWPIIGDEAEGWFGPYFNVLPIITIVLFIMQQKLFTPPATDDQTKMQQSMMTYMTLFMGIMFYRVPAGLCVYIITSSLWGIAERKLLPKPKPKDGDEEAFTKQKQPPPKQRPAIPGKKKKK